MIVECDEDVTATEATKADGDALGMRLITNGELDAHREESPELIGSEAVEDRRGRENVLSKELEMPLAREWHVDAQDSQGLNLGLEERVRRKLILAGIPSEKRVGQRTVLPFKG